MAPIPSDDVRDQSPRSFHNRHDSPNASQARLAPRPVAAFSRNARTVCGRPAATPNVDLKSPSGGVYVAFALKSAE